jgi:hypothetical protein
MAPPQPDELTNTLYYATGVLPQPKPFSFQTKRLRIDWRALVGVDVNAVVSSRCIGTAAVVPGSALRQDCAEG